MKARAFNRFSLLVGLCLLLALLGTLAAAAQGPKEPAGQRGDAPRSVTAPAVDLGEAGLSFHYVETFGTSEEPYIVDADHLNGPNGISLDGAGNLWVAEWDGQRALKYSPSGAFQMSIGDPGPEGVFDALGDVDVGPGGTIWVADSYKHRVVQFSAAGEYLDHLGVEWESGSDNGHFSQPLGLAFDSAGNLYVSDGNNYRVQIFDNTGIYSATLGVTGEPGSDNAHFGFPDCLFVDHNDNLYVADAGNHRVQIFDSTGAYSATLGVSGESGWDNAHFDGPSDVTVDASGHIYVADTGNHRVQIFDSGLNYVATLGETGVSGSDNNHFDEPEGVAVDSNGNIYVSDWVNLRVQKFDSGLNYLSTVGTTGVPYVTDDSHFNAPWGIAVASDGSIYVTENRGYRLVKLNADGAQQWAIGQAGIYGDDNAHFGSWWAGPEGNVALDAAGRVYVPDTGNQRIQIFNVSGVYEATFGSYGTGDYEFDCPVGVAISPVNGDIFVSDTCNQRIQVYDGNRAYKATLGVTDVPGSDDSHFDGPRGVALDTHGNIYVADGDNRRVQKCSLNGASYTCATFAGETDVYGDDFSHLSMPQGVAVDSAGRVYVTDQWNNRVQVFDSTGAYLTTIGGEWGTNTGQLIGPVGIAVDSLGNVYVADKDNHRIQKFAPGVPGWQQVNINGFGDKANVGGGISLKVFGDHLFAGLGNPAGGQLWRTADGSSWTQITGNGFENMDNEFIRLGTVFDDYLYVGTGNGETGCEVWRSDDGLAWTQVVSNGLGDATNTSMGPMVVFDNYLYAATWNDSAGTEVWRTPDGIAWLQVNNDGFGDPYNIGPFSMAIFNNALCVGAQNFDTGAEIWCTSDGTNWEQANTDGFGDPRNQWPSLAVYNGYLYVGTANDSTDTYVGTGTQIWRSEDGTSWDQVVGDGFGDATNGGSDMLGVFDGSLYSGTYNRVSGTQLRKTTDGIHWTKVAPDGFGDSNNYSTYGKAAFEGSLFLATANEANGGEIWVKLRQVYLPIVLRNH